MRQPPAGEVFDIYNEFRKEAGLEPDPSPAANVFVSDSVHGKQEVYVVPEDTDQDDGWTTSVNETINLSFSFDVCATDDAIKAAIEELQRKALAHPGRHWTALSWVKDAKGRSRDWSEINMILGKCLHAHQIGRPLSSIVTALELADSSATDEEWKSAEREAKRMLDRAGNLIEAARAGFIAFCQEAMKPLPRNR